MPITNINLHIHSNFSDGSNSIEQIVNAALNLNLEYICIADHFSNSWKSKVIPTLDNSNKILNYLSTINKLNTKLIAKNAKLRVLKGIEIDIFSEQNYIFRLINPKDFDLILFEYIESYEAIAFVSNILNYWRRFTNEKELCSLFVAAHLDPSYFYFDNFNCLIDFFHQNNLIYEFNASYPHSYSPKYQDLFKRLSQFDIMFSVGSDSHEKESLGNIESVLQMIDYYNLSDNYLKLVNEIRGLFSKNQKDY
jgi:DNA polymerase (family 10)